MVGLSGGNTISALHMRMNSFLNDIMGRVRMNYFPVWIFSLVVESGSSKSCNHGEKPKIL
jgi:hypothetical protein